MAVGKKESKTISLSGTVSETAGLTAQILNYARSTAFAVVTITGTYTVTVIVYGSPDLAEEEWRQISSQPLSASGWATPVDIPESYDAVRISYSGSGTGSATLKIFLNRKRH